ncbi:MAG TPA: hypothetical protein VK742_05870 [Candidatus Sulfotelmatobacter sp.]|nr:hypothetical protein [Candidatus Sulfotelmatobacter sp.]
MPLGQDLKSPAERTLVYLSRIIHCINQQSKTNPGGFLWLWLVLVAGLADRFAIGAFGHNFDFDSCRIIADLMARGENVYANTDRYNYGPVWFNLIHLLDMLAGHDPRIFRWLLTGVLSAVDVGIFFVLLRKFGGLAATVFFLNPISIIITGYHNQFDNLAILLGLWAVLLFGEEFEKPPSRRQFLALILLGLSLMTKHLLFAFPFWLALKQKGFVSKCVVVLVPLAVFGLGFAPYWPGGGPGIVDNVFYYRSLDNHYFYNFFVPAVLQPVISPQTVWFLMLGLFAFLCRKKTALKSLLIYTVVLVATSPATNNQYLAIPLAFTAVFINFFTVCYTLTATYHLCVDADGLHLLEKFGYYADLAIYILCFALIWTLWRQNILSFLQKCRKKIKKPAKG